MKILVIIVTYNGMKWLERCLNSVVNSSIPLDAYIVDNGSTDGSQEFIQANYPQFTFYQSPTNSGFGAANNIGLEYAIEHGYDYVYLLNQDAWVMAETIETLINQHKKNPEFGIISPLQTNAEMTKLDRNFVYGSIAKTSITSDFIFNNVKEIYEVEDVMAAHWLVSRECLIEVGGFSSTFQHYGEDNEYLMRAKYRGFKTAVVPSVVGVHDREFREETKSKSIYMLSILFLVIASNPNKSFAKSLFMAYAKSTVFAIYQSIIHKDLTVWLRCIIKVPPFIKIYRGRQIAKFDTTPFLKINKQ
ncbi:MAG: glycosyltransferase family 2 protein [Rikenellaceae bacterium]